MVAVADLERFLERVFERTSARLFRSRIQAVQVERRVERAMEAGRTGRGGSTTVPNRYRVRIHPADLDDLAARSGGFEALAVRLADRALAFARLHAYHLTARPMVSVVADPSVERGRVEVDASDGQPGPASAAGGRPKGDEQAPEASAALPSPAEPIPSTPASLAAEQPPVAELAPAAAPLVMALGAPGPAPVEAPSPVPAPPLAPAADAPPARAVDIPAEPEAGPPPDGGASSPDGLPSGVAATQAHGLRAGDRPYAVRPVPPPPSRALIRVVEPGGREREVRVEGQPLTLGRADDNGLVIADARISRHHGRFQARHGTLVYTDLGSTNGTRVNGIRVDEIVLGPGDRLQIGDVVLVIEQLPG